MRFDEQRSHSYWNQYWTGPLDPNISINNDTAISYLEGTDRDFKWTPLHDKPHYLSIQSVLAITGAATRDQTGDANSRIFFQLMLRADKPDLQKELALIEKLQDGYDKYNRGLEPSELLFRSSLVEKVQWGTNTSQESLTRAAYIEENTSKFDEEIETDPYLKDIIELTSLVKKYIEIQPPVFVEGGEPIKVGGFIKDSEWYKSLSSDRKVGLKKVLENLDYQTYRYFTYKYDFEAVQCVTWTMLMASLAYDNSPKNVLSHVAVYARELIPEELRTQPWLKEMTIGSYKYIVPEKLSDINVGDLFITYELPYESAMGHVGAIVGKKEIEGEITLLVSCRSRCPRARRAGS